MNVRQNITDKQKYGMIVCIPKDAQAEPPLDYRHLTLLNTDLKFLSSILADRLSPWLSFLLHPMQHFGTHKNTTVDATAAVREAIAHTEQLMQTLCILCIDFKAEFDIMSHS
jgi:hypothetical protein